LTPAFEDTIRDGVREIVVVEDAPPVRQGLVGREDHRAPLAMAIVHDVKQHVGRVRAIGQVAHFVD
jgi:hypothetical protein